MVLGVCYAARCCYRWYIPQGKVKPVVPTSAAGLPGLPQPQTDCSVVADSAARDFLKADEGFRCEVGDRDCCSCDKR